jgi:hypothetical protein
MDGGPQEPMRFVTVDSRFRGNDERGVLRTRPKQKRPADRSAGLFVFPVGPLRAISRQMETSAGSEIAIKQSPRAADLMQSDREPL